MVHDKFTFLHVPKTGGWWAVEAMTAAGIQLREPQPAVVGADISYGHAGRREVLGPDFTIAFVRHPLAWWRSYWAQRMRENWEPEHLIGSDYARSDFNEFIELVIADFPGYLGELLEAYTGPPEDEIAFVGRAENLALDLCKGLRMAGVEFEAARLLAHPAANIGLYERYPADYRPELADRLLEAESAVIERWYPDRR